MVALLLVLHALAAIAGLTVPRILGALVDDAAAPGTPVSRLTSLGLAVGAVVVMQAVLTFGALLASTVLGQDVLAGAREHIVRTVLRLPLGRVESASSGDLVTRVTRDVSTMSESVRFGLPEVVIAAVTTVLTLAAMLLNSVLLTLPLLVTAPLLVIGVRRYLKRAPKGYITEGSTYSTINTTLTETVEGARTVEAFGLQRRRVVIGDEDIAVSAQAERYTMSLRNILFSFIGLAYDTPLVMVMVLGAIGYSTGALDPGPDHGGDPLRAGAGGAVGAADPQPGPAAGRGRLDDPAAGHRRGPPGPGGRRRAAARDPARGPGPAVRVPRGSRGAARGLAGADAGGAAGHRRAQRLGQVDPGTAAVGDQPAGVRAGHRRRGRSRRRCRWTSCAPRWRW